MNCCCFICVRQRTVCSNIIQCIYVDFILMQSLFFETSWQAGVVERCGAFDSVVGAGCHMLIPCVHTLPVVLSLKLKQLDVKCETKVRKLAYTEKGNDGTPPPFAFHLLYLC